MYYTGAAVVPLYRFIFTVSLSNFTSLMSICLICTSLRLSVALMYVAAVSKHTGLHINTSSWKEQRGPKEPGCELFFFTLFFSLPSCYIYTVYMYELTSNLQCIIAAKVSYLTSCGQRRDILKW